MMNTNDVMIRQVEPNDLNFIYDSCYNSMKSDSKLAKSCRISIFNKEFRSVLDSILATSTTVVACVRNEPSVILGYLIHTQDVVHFVFVKEAFRKLRITYLMMAYAFGMEEKPLQCSLLTDTARSILKKHPKFKMEHNPFLLFNKEI